MVAPHFLHKTNSAQASQQFRRVHMANPCPHAVQKNHFASRLHKPGFLFISSWCPMCQISRVLGHVVSFIAALCCVVLSIPHLCAVFRSNACSDTCLHVRCAVCSEAFPGPVHVVLTSISACTSFLTAPQGVIEGPLMSHTR